MILNKIFKYFSLLALIVLGGFLCFLFLWFFISGEVVSFLKGLLEDPYFVFITQVLPITVGMLIPVGSWILLFDNFRKEKHKESFLILIMLITLYFILAVFSIR